MAYHYPTIDLLRYHNTKTTFTNENYVRELALLLSQALKAFKVKGEIVEVRATPFAVMFDIKPDTGVSVKTYRNLRIDLEVSLGSPVEIVSTSEKQFTVGIAVKQWNRPVIGLRDIMESKEYEENSYEIPVAAGMDVLGKPFIFDLASTPHLLVAGTTGSGKSTFLNCIVMNTVYTKSPEEVQFIMIDPKRIELGAYDKIPHMIKPVVKETKEALEAIRWLDKQMSLRYELLSKAGYKSIETFNNKEGREDKISHIIFLVDEYMEMMFDAPKEMEQIIHHISRMGRAAGIHLVLATQRPSTDVITGGIKANIPCRASFTVVDWRESKTIIDRTGAERLLGNGDMLFSAAESSTPIHAQAAYVSYEEVDRVIAAISR